VDGLDRKVGVFLNASSAYEIPPYQRNYEWDATRWQGMVNDVVQAATRGAAEPPHWFGIILLTEAEEPRFPGDKSVSHYTVIDGQQRLVTLLVWLAALADHVVDKGKPRPLDVSKLAAVTVQHSDETPFRVAITNQWRDPKYQPLLEAESSPLLAYYYFRWMLWLGEDALLKEDPLPMTRRLPLKAGETFESQWATFVGTKRGKQLPRGNAPSIDALVDTTMERLVVHTLLHNPRTDETPAVIFDTLNGDRTELEPIDHVRNSLFIRIRPRAQADKLYREKWEPQESTLRRAKTKRTTPAKLFLYDYVISMGEKLRQKSLNANRGAAHFAIMTRNMSDAALEKFVVDSFLPSMATWPVVVRQSDSVVLDGVAKVFPRRVLELMTSIQELTTNPANPVVLLYATANLLGSISDSDFEEALFATETYLARQLLAARPLSPLRSRLMDVMAHVDKDLNPSKLKSALLSTNWVTDPDVMTGGLDRNYYATLSPRQLGAIFRGIERSMSRLGGAMAFHLGTGDDDYTIEHIYPQDPRKWKADITRWKANGAKMDSLVHTLGNLTVATNKHNRKVGNGTFAQKQALPHTPGKVAPLNLNKDWLGARRWTEKEISQRTTQLLKEALSYWRTL
jgi:hypothetical protein